MNILNRWQSTLVFISLLFAGVIVHHCWSFWLLYGYSFLVVISLLWYESKLDRSFELEFKDTSAALKAIHETNTSASFDRFSGNDLFHALNTEQNMYDSQFNLLIDRKNSHQNGKILRFTIYAATIAMVIGLMTLDVPTPVTNIVNIRLF